MGVVMLGIARDEVAPLVGRAQEQSLLTSLLDVVGDRGQALVLRGEPGIGKSRLLSIAAQTARERAAELPPIQRDALDAAFGLTSEVAPATSGICRHADRFRGGQLPPTSAR
jgi:hypothetical protein